MAGGSLLSPVTQKEAAVGPADLALKFPQGSERFGNAADVVLGKGLVVYENDATVINAALAPVAEKRWNGFQVN